MDILRDLAAWRRASPADREAAARRCLDLLRPGWAPRADGFTFGGAPFFLLPGRYGSAPLMVARQAVEVAGLRRPTPAEWARIVEPTDPKRGHLFGLEGGPDRSVAEVALPPDPLPPGDLSALATPDAWILKERAEVVAAFRRFQTPDVVLVEIRGGPLTFLPCPCGGSGRKIEWEPGGTFLHYEGADQARAVVCPVCRGWGSYWEERQAPVGVYRRDGRLFALRPGDPPTLDVL